MTAEERKNQLLAKIQNNQGYVNKDGSISGIDKINKALNEVLNSNGNTLFDIKDPNIIIQLYEKIKALGNDPNGKYRAIVSNYHCVLTGNMIGNNKNTRTYTPPSPTKTACSFNKILYGAPGTGKSHKVKTEIEDNKGKLAAAYRTTFHPDTDYTTFVGCYKPFKPNNGGSLDYKFVPQAFLKAYVAAWKAYVAWKNEPEEKRDPKLVYLVIEEINRGNCAQAFGDIFQLLDRDEKGFSKYHITPDEDICNYLKTELGNDYNKYERIIHELVGIQNTNNDQEEEAEDTDSMDDIWTENVNEGLMLLPGNLIIRATMNTSDQSLFPMDSAFKRRWDWEYVPIDYDNKEAKRLIIGFGDSTAKWVDVLKTINKKIVELTHSNKKQMGEFFAGTADITFEAFRDKVLFFLFTDALKDRKGFAEKFGKDIKFYEDFFDIKDGGKKIILEWVEKMEGVTVTEKTTDKNGLAATENENDTNPTPTNNGGNANNAPGQATGQEEVPGEVPAEGENIAVEQDPDSQE